MPIINVTVSTNPTQVSRANPQNLDIRWQWGDQQSATVVIWAPSQGQSQQNPWLTSTVSPPSSPRYTITGAQVTNAPGDHAQTTDFEVRVEGQVANFRITP